MKPRIFNCLQLWRKPVFTMFAMPLLTYGAFGAPLQGGRDFLAAKELSAPLSAEPGFVTYADLLDRANMVAIARVKKQIVLKDPRSAAAPNDSVRLYIEAETQALLSGVHPVGPLLRYLVDVKPINGKVPKLKKQTFIVFGQNTAERPNDIRLLGTEAQMLWSPERETLTREILRQMLAPNAPPRVTGIRDVLSVAGTLAGESETQIFLDTEDGTAATISVTRRAGSLPYWGISWSDIVDQAAAPTAQNTLEWYRLACFLPAQLPQRANLSDDMANRRRAAEDYRFVIESLGKCARPAT